MGHEHHFLSRLDRISLPQVEIALSLYRDHRLVHYLLQQLGLPDGVERVAFSLDHPERGPFVLVTRAGKFVTCLAEGMSVSGAPIVTRARLDALSRRVTELRTRMELAQKMAGPKGKASQILRRIYTAGYTLSREEFLAISAFSPLLDVQFFKLLWESTMDLEETRITLWKVERPKRKLHPLLKAFWNTYWALGHLSMLSLIDGRRFVERLAQGIDFGQVDVAFPCVRNGTNALAAKGLWAAGKAGKLLLPGYKARFQADPIEPLDLISSSLGLAVLGQRHGSLRGEVMKTLGAGRTFRDSPYGRYLDALRSNLVNLLTEDLEDPKPALDTAERVGAQLAVAFSQARLPPHDARRFNAPEDVPGDVARAMILNDQSNYLVKPEPALSLARLMPLVARSKPEDFYLGREHLYLLQSRWIPDETMVLLDSMREHYRIYQDTRQIVAGPGRPPRKGPCPCGSSKKYKRCCGAEETS